MTTIWKFPFETTDHIEIEMPEDAIVLRVQAQRGVPCLWVQCNSDAPLEKRKFRIYGTGHEVDPFPQDYIGTYQLMDDQLVFHVFAERLR